MQSRPGQSVVNILLTIVGFHKKYFRYQQVNPLLAIAEWLFITLLNTPGLPYTIYFKRVI